MGAISFIMFDIKIIKILGFLLCCLFFLGVIRTVGLVLLVFIFFGLEMHYLLSSIIDNNLIFNKSWQAICKRFLFTLENLSQRVTKIFNIRITGVLGFLSSASLLFGIMKTIQFIILVFIFFGLNPNYLLKIITNKKVRMIADNEELPKGNLLLVFITNWCETCKELHPILENLYERIQKEKINVQIVKIDCEANHQISQFHNIHKVPAIVLSVNKKDFQYDGIYDENHIFQWIQKKL